jgi:hypothetical protein
MSTGEDEMKAILHFEEERWMKEIPDKSGLWCSGSQPDQVVELA